MATYLIKPKKLPDGIQNILNRGLMRRQDQYPLKVVANDGRFPFFILNKSSLGYLMKLDFINGKSWDEQTRVNFITRLQEGLKLESQISHINYSYSFSVVRSKVDPSEFDRFSTKGYPLTQTRIDNAKDLASNLEIQSLSLYFSVTASPSGDLIGDKFSWWQRVKANLWDKKLAAEIENELLEDLVTEFGDKVKQLIALFTSLGVSTQAPKTEAEILLLSRKAWRPNYKPSEEKLDKESLDLIKRSLASESFISAQDFILKDLRVEQYRNHWIADGCFNMLFSMEEAPDPNIAFSASEIDKLLTLGKRPGISNIPYFGTYTVTWSEITRTEGDKKFKIKSAFTRSMTSDRKGWYEDKLKNKEASDIENMHEQFIAGESSMGIASVMFQLSIPVKHMEKFFANTITDKETVRSIERTLIQQLGDIGYSSWVVEDRSYYPAWINSMPGTIRCTSRYAVLPQLYLPMDGIFHLIPFYATLGAEGTGGKSWRGSNYFQSDEGVIFVFDHFSKKNGPAANFAICGATGSGKSVIAQTFTMMTEKLNPNVMILDFGGGDVGSWTKLCSVMGGVELKFGSSRPPRINPFHLSESDSYPNERKRKHIAYLLGGENYDDELLHRIDTVYNYLRGDKSPHILSHVRKKEICDICPEFESRTYEEIMVLLSLKAGDCKPGEKGSESIRVILELLLASSITEDGPTENVWSTFSLDDMNEAILKLFETYEPPLKDPARWPTLSDFKNSIQQLHKEKLSSSKKDGWGINGVVNYPLLMSRLTNYCVGGLDPFLDGQTNVAIRQKKMINGVEREVPAKFILADMAGITDNRKKALYMIVINDFMTDILYNSKDSRGVMIRDEAWLFMKSKIAAPYLEADYRLARKYGFSVITIAQQYGDFKSSVLQNNTQNWVICALSHDEVNKADARFHFNSAERNLFLNNQMGFKMEYDSLTKKISDAYSRVMISNQSGRYFVRNKIGKEERWITTTDADETFVYNYLKETKMRGKHPIEIIKWLCTDEYLQDKDLEAALEGAGRKMPRM